jgi:hypothetical protein
MARLRKFYVVIIENLVLDELFPCYPLLFFFFFFFFFFFLFSLSRNRSSLSSTLSLSHSPHMR